MQYAIVDIETTGGFPAQHGITEIAIVLHNGKEVEGQYSTLINPQQPIPPYIVGMTGISNAMVADAPTFIEVAPYIYNLLQNRVFVAHNVNFDFSFVKHFLQQAGLSLQVPKLCTIRLSKKVFPGLPKYGLASLCDKFDIQNEARHRAGGDAMATTILLEKIIAKDGFETITRFLKKEKKSQLLPPHLPLEQVMNLPYSSGVYYFHDAKGKVIYVGKAKNIKFRVNSHFSGFDAGKKRQAFLKNIHSISYKECSTEFMAALFESIEIKRLWPAFNYSQKRFEQQWGIYLFEDVSGYKRLAIDKKKKNIEPVIAFPLMAEAHRMLWKLVREFELHPYLCFLDKNPASDLPDQHSYNISVHKAIEWVQSEKQSYIIKEKDNIILIENGQFYGMGEVSATINDYSNIEQLKSLLTQYPENEVLKSMLRNYKEKYPQNVVALNTQQSTPHAHQ